MTRIKSKDPDEENIVGLDKIDVARSNSLRLAPISSLSDRSSIGNRKSFFAKKKQQLVKIKTMTLKTQMKIYIL
nr:BPK_HP1_G0043630.mRNA.1.CDS.1 [Saccharomyces cerevisiae]